ncbi:MAG: rod-binding protein [Tepidisphaerales bacterium]
MPIAAAKTSHAAGNGPLVKPAQQLVSHAFFGAILKQMHQSPWRSAMFSGGQAGRSFESLLDDRLADRMANNHSSRKLVNSIVKKLEKKTGGDRSPSGPLHARNGGFGETALPQAEHGGSGETALPSTLSPQPVADPVDTVLSNAAAHLGFLSQAPRIDLKG